MTYSLPQVEIVNNTAVTTSLAVAEYFGKRHDQVLESIRNAQSQVSDFFRDQNFLESKYVPNGQTRSYPMYYLTKNGFVFLVMGFTGDEAGRIKEAYINAFDQMESKLRAQAQCLSPNQDSHWMNRCMELQEELLQLYRKQVEQKRPRRRLTIDAIWEIRLLHEQEFSLDSIVELTGHNEATIAHVLNPKRPN